MMYQIPKNLLSTRLHMKNYLVILNHNPNHTNYLAFLHHNVNHIERFLPIKYFMI